MTLKNESTMIVKTASTRSNIRVTQIVIVKRSLTVSQLSDGKVRLAQPRSSRSSSSLHRSAILHCLEYDKMFLMVTNQPC